MKYGLSLNGIILYGYKRDHKKSGLWTYTGVISGYDNNAFCVPLEFETKRQAYIWILQHSSFPRFNDFLSSPSLTDELLETLYLKGKYTLARVNWYSLNKAGLLNNGKMPLLCEILIHEQEV